VKRGLFLKYIVLFVGLVSGVLVINSALDLYFVYQDNRRASIDVQREKAEAASQKVESFVREIEHQIGWVAYPQWAARPVEERRFEYVRLLRQVPAITELTQLDRNGHEQLKVSRLSMDVVGSDIDRSAEPAFKEAAPNKPYFGPVYYRKESEPYLSMAVAHGGRNGGVTVAEINLKLILDVIAQIKVGKDGYAYVVDRLGRLVAHPDISLVLRGTDMNRLAQVKAARQDNGVNDTALEAKDLSGRSVLSAHAEIPALNWLVFVDLPSKEALQPVIDTGLRDIALLVLGLLIAGTVAALLARRMVVPIRALQAGAQRIGSGELGHRLSIKTGDELEALANQFNRSAEALEESYATLEQRVEDRTAELRESLEQQTATADVLAVINGSPGDLAPVFDAMLEKAVRLCEADSGHLALPDGEDYRTVAAFSMSPEMESVIRSMSYAPGRGTAVGRALLERSAVQINDIGADPEHTGRVAAERGLIRTILGVPLLREGEPIGAFGLSRSRVEPFTERQIELVRTFADQAVIAMENARLITETRESLEQQTATAEILHVISQSPTDVAPVLKAVTAAARRFCGAEDAGDAGITLREGSDLVVAAADGTMLTVDIGRRDPLDRASIRGRSIIDGVTIHVPDMLALDDAEYGRARKQAMELGFRALLCAPMLRDGGAIGCITLRKPEPGDFTQRQIELLESFAAQAVIAIQNVRLFTEIQDKSPQLELASQHKSQFLANMSHELRTPLNAILGYTEMMTDGLYGDMPEKAQTVLERVQSNGKHLLGLINDVLDLSKIEAGQLALTIEDYSVADMVATVTSATESLARTKGIALNSAVAPGLPMGKGDARRLTQVLLNLVGNAIKFTDQGSVEIRGAAVGPNFELSVVDTGFGIAPEDQAKIFEEFQQVDNSSTRKKGGTGLGLSISRKIVELHGGAITVTSEVGKGSIFKVTIPVTATAAKDAA
jgi:signal transduction histidine kinase